MAEDITFVSLEERSQILHTLLTDKGQQLSPEHIQIDTKICNDFIEKVKRQVTRTDQTHLKLRSLEVKASKGGDEPEANYPVHIDPHTSQMMYSPVLYNPEAVPATNYSTAWVFTTSSGGDIVRPYIMPGPSTASSGATIYLHKNGDIWNVTFQVVPSPHTVQITSERRGYVGLYVKIDGEDIYLMPHTTVAITTELNIVGTELNIVGTKQGNFQTYVWIIKEVDHDYVLPVPKSHFGETPASLGETHDSLGETHDSLGETPASSSQPSKKISCCASQ